jgi:pimeloyl-ACP methyl ester carboxylesterase
MGHIDAALHPTAVELLLPWGPVIRGVRWGAGPDRVLLLHEPGADIDAWGTLPSHLAQSLGVEALAVDLPGHGLSDDPWEPEMIGEFVRHLTSVSVGLPAPAIVPHPPSAVASGEETVSRMTPAVGRQFAIAAGSVAASISTFAADLQLAGLVALSPTAVTEFEPEATTITPPSLGSTGRVPSGRRSREVWASVPKLFIAGSHASDDLETARRLASTSRGWTVVTSLPVPERGTALLQTTWQTRLCEEITAFLRDCMHPTPAFPPPRPIAPHLSSQRDSG